MGGSGLIYAQNNTSYGGELYGIYIVLRFILQMWRQDTGKKEKIRIRCDNLSGILDSNQTKLKTKRSKTFRAILRSIKKNILLLKNRGLIISLSHIKGHQDDEENFQNLTRWAQLNVIADHKAKKIS